MAGKKIQTLESDLRGNEKKLQQIREQTEKLKRECDQARKLLAKAARPQETCTVKVWIKRIDPKLR